MTPPHVTLTPAPNAIFMRIGGGMVEMSPGEALRVCDELQACIRISLAAADGSALRTMIAAGPGCA